MSGKRIRTIAAAVFLAACPGRVAIAAHDDVADVPSKELRAGGDEKKQYFLIGPAKGSPAPQDGYKLLIVMPGGDGSADFHPFVKGIFKKALPKDYVVAQLVAPKWAEEQARNVVWPTRTSPWKGMAFSTEEFVDAVIKDASANTKIDAPHVYSLSWSSSGPAAYAISLQKSSPVRGSFVAMSVFHPKQLPPLSAASGHAYYLYQSPDDKVCKLKFAEQAHDELTAAGANVTLVEYEGGHGWHGDVFGDIRTGIQWLETNAGKANASKDPSNKRDKPAKKHAAGGNPNAHGENLIENGGFEHGTEGWIVLKNSGRATVEIDKSVKSRGDSSLRIEKTGGAPMDVVRRNITGLPKGGKVTVSAMVKAKGVKNAFVKFFVYDDKEESLIDDVDLQRVTGTSDWKRIEKTYEIPASAASGAVMIVMVLDGTMWIDEVRVEKPQ